MAGHLSSDELAFSISAEAPGRRLSVLEFDDDLMDAEDEEVMRLIQLNGMIGLDCEVLDLE